MSRHMPTVSIYPYTTLFLSDHLMAELPLGSGKNFIIRGERGTVPYFILSTWTAAEPAVPGASSWADQGLEGLEDFNPALLQTGDCRSEEHTSELQSRGHLVC